MSFTRQTDQVLTGGLALIPASNLIPKDAAIACKNWRVDQQGALRSRLDMSLLASFAGDVHSLHTRRGTPTRYTGWDDALSRGTTTIETGFDGKPLGFADMYGYTWIMNQAKQVRDDGTTVGPWAPSAPGSAPTLTGVAGGVLAIDVEYTYWVTWVDNQGQETNPSDPATFTPSNPNQNCQITRPGSPGSTITGWNIYRGGNTLSQPYLLNSTPIDIATTDWIDDGGAGFTDEGIAWTQYSDDGLVELGGVMATDHDGPPACKGLAGPYYERLLAWNSAAHGNWFYWSIQGQPSFFPGSALDEGNHVPIGKDGEEVVTAILRDGHVRIYKEASIWRITGDVGDPDSRRLDETNPEIGLIGESAIDSRGDLDYFQADEGIYESNGFTVRKISGVLDPLFKGDDLKIVNALTPPKLERDLSIRKLNRLQIFNGRLYFSYTSIGNFGPPDTTLVCDLDTGRWFHDDRPFNALHDEGQGLYLLGAAGGNVYKLEQGQTTTIDVEYQSAYRDQGERDHVKTYGDVVIEYSVVDSGVSTATINVSAYYDDGATGGVIGAITVQDPDAPASRRYRDVFKLEDPSDPNSERIARNISIRIGGNIDQELVIYSIEVHYYLHPRDSTQFDTGVIDLDFVGAKRADLVQLDLDAPGAVDWKVFSDLPGGAIALRASGTIESTSGREQVALGLDPVVEGQLLRLTLKSVVGTTFRLYSCRIRHHRIGLYVDAGETYRTVDF